MRKSKIVRGFDGVDMRLTRLENYALIGPYGTLDNLRAEIRGLYKRVNAMTEYLEVEFALRPAEPEKIVVEKKKKKTS